MNEQSIDVIDDIIHKNCERKSIRLNEEIKLYSNNIKNFNNTYNNMVRNNDDNLNDIYEDVEIEDEDEEEKDNDNDNEINQEKEEKND